MSERLESINEQLEAENFLALSLADSRTEAIANKDAARFGHIAIAQSQVSSRIASLKIAQGSLENVNQAFTIQP